MLRLIAMAINDEYQAAVTKALEKLEGKFEFKKVRIKGDARMRNKCLTSEDHRTERKPR